MFVLLTVVVADECVEVERRLVPAAVLLLEGGMEFVVVDVDISGVDGERHCFWAWLWEEWGRLLRWGFGDG
jgi:hypothetical protein